MVMLLPLSHIVINIVTIFSCRALYGSSLSQLQDVISACPQLEVSPC